MELGWHRSTNLSFSLTSVSLSDSLSPSPSLSTLRLIFYSFHRKNDYIGQKFIIFKDRKETLHALIMICFDFYSTEERIRLTSFSKHFKPYGSILQTTLYLYKLLEFIYYFSHRLYICGVKDVRLYICGVKDVTRNSWPPSLKLVVFYGQISRLILSYTANG